MHRAADAGTADQGSKGDANGNGGEPDAGVSQACVPALSSTPTVIVDPDLGYPPSPSFVWTGFSVAAVWAGAGGAGYRLLELNTDGSVAVPVRTLWASQVASQSPTLAVSTDVLAIVDQVGEGDNQRQVCRIAIAGLLDHDSIAGPTRFSDPPNQDTILNEVQYCTVAAADNAFFVVWQQMTSDSSLAFSVFGQWFNLDGSPQGSRITFAAISDKPFGQIPVASDGKRVAVITSSDSSSGYSLHIVEGDQVHVSALSLDGAVSQSAWMQLHAAHDGWIVGVGEQLWLLDANGNAAHGPVMVDATSLVGPLGNGYVRVSHEEFLVARGLNEHLALGTVPVGLSTNRDAMASALVYAADGSATFLVYSDGGNLQLAKLSCSDQEPPPPGPGSCPNQAPLMPLDNECRDAVCHVIVRLDYLTLGALGWQVVGSGSAAVDADAGSELGPVDADGAWEAARVVFAAQPYVSSDITVTGPEAGVFSAYVPAVDFGAYALVGEESGVVITAGGVVYAGHGDYWTPRTWRSAADIACGDKAAVPSETFFDPHACDMTLSTPPPTSGDALDLALKSNLAAYLNTQGPFSAYVYKYTPAVGLCDDGAAEYLVILTQTMR